MVRERLALLACAALAVAGAACGGPNAQACESWRSSVVALECVPDDFEDGYDCAAYDDHPCDVSEYFECLENSYTCSDDGVFQPNDAECSDLAGC